MAKNGFIVLPLPARAGYAIIISESRVLTPRNDLINRISSLQTASCGLPFGPSATPMFAPASLPPQSRDAESGHGWLRFEERGKRESSAFAVTHGFLKTLDPEYRFAISG